MISISRIEVSIVEMPLIHPFIVGFGTITHTSSAIVRIFDKDGACGIGETAMTDVPMFKPDYTASVWTTLNTVILPRLVGKAFVKPDEIMQSLAFIRGNYFAKAAVSTALYDLYAQKQGKSIVNILGGTRDRVKISRTVPLYESPEQTLAAAQKFYEEGIRWLKLKIVPGRDIKFIQMLKKHLPDIKLMVDANASYEYSDNTVSLFKSMDDLGLFSIEQPLTWNDIVFHAKLQRELKTDLSLDESLDDAHSARQALEIGACRSGNIKMSRVGGYEETKKIEQLFRAKALPVWIGGAMETPVGIHHNLAAATLEGCTLPIDFIEPLYLTERFFESFTTSLYTIKGDEVIIDASQPGLGISLHENVFGKLVKEAVTHR
jgi:O-succinylbenzoate synthase